MLGNCHSDKGMYAKVRYALIVSAQTRHEIKSNILGRGNGLYHETLPKSLPALR